MYGNDEGLDDVYDMRPGMNDELNYDMRGLAGTAEIMKTLSPAKVRSLSGNSFHVACVGSVFVFILSSLKMGSRPVA